MIIRNYQEIIIFGETVKLYSRNRFEAGSLEEYAFEQKRLNKKLSAIKYDSLIISDSLKPNVVELTDELESTSKFRILKRKKLKKLIEKYELLFSPSFIAANLSFGEIILLCEQIVYDIEETPRNNSKENEDKMISYRIIDMYILTNSKMDYNEIMLLPVKFYYDLFFAIVSWGNFMRGGELELQTAQDKANELMRIWQICLENRKNWSNN